MNWPPLIDDSRLPWWVIARDTVATLLAWALLLYAIRDMVWMAAYWLLRLVGAEIAPPWSPGRMWRDTAPFLEVVALLVVWLAVFVVARWHRLTDRRRARSQPAPLDPQRQAEALGVRIDTASRMHNSAACTVHGVDPSTGRGGEVVEADAPPT
ncbi:hypothetical protein [Lysobacter auxotrophicus]|uniref:Poly-beta-1,6-N-acetyl-D-glucosamine biosynthesis protein PgaD n=1 Tax=Lysobacter auxotrophicus TaxID=2992573 RepID=A0ABN6UK54_9GAMM|nr:hypothetical protein [Lysobacter auxotrophicus]BDU16698.1 poly-beta-1,6-N-acetyl-D-glucosamine biosynthesis protein PgaD [Lysobacter auxotrophicus]